MNLMDLGQRAAHWQLLRRGLLSRYTETPAGRLHWYDAPGAGSHGTAVVLHGFGSGATAYGKLVLALRRHFHRVIAPDAPGHGHSAVPEAPLTPAGMGEAVGGLLDSVLEAPALVYGNSLGGAIAIRYASTRPDRVRALAISSPGGAPVEAERHREFLGRFDLQTTRDARVFLDRLFHRPPWYTPLLAPGMRRRLGAAPLRRFIESVGDDDLLSPDELARLQMPLLFWWGTSEHLMLPEHLAFFEAHLPPHATVERPDGVGHCPHLEVPGPLADRIAEFSRSIPRPTGCKPVQ